MAKPNHIELPTGERIPILYEDRSVLAIDKPAGWMLVPFNWQKTSRNLQAALTSSIAAKDFWARSRGLKFLRFVHRLDSDTSGVLLLAKSPGAVHSIGALFESRRMEKVYLAVVLGTPTQREWTCRLKLAPDPAVVGQMKVDARQGKDAETRFRVLQDKGGLTLVEAHPVTGRTHQIRIHLAESGYAVIGDPLYGPPAVVKEERPPRGDGRRFTPALSPPAASRAGVPPACASGDAKPEQGRRDACPTLPPSGKGGRGNSRQASGGPRLWDNRMGLRAVRLSYADPFTRRRVDIRAPCEQFVREYGFDIPTL
ncbi:MAG TPA: RNA pseudouridine synthase [Candidatus Paceibacterota bacterium]|nr:RNA pseudouridine synthase [Verrucomicrobiota bacterium]HSA11985.1 RNA pseudouridine synthase [Candidatus Paceibacterota bacterium]